MESFAVAFSSCSLISSRGLISAIVFPSANGPSALCRATETLLPTGSDSGEQASQLSMRKRCHFA